MDGNSPGGNSPGGNSPDTVENIGQLSRILLLIV